MTGRVAHIVTSPGFGGVERRMQIIAQTASSRAASSRAASSGRDTSCFIALGGGGVAEEEIARSHEVVCLHAKPAVYSGKKGQRLAPH